MHNHKTSQYQFSLNISIHHYAITGKERLAFLFHQSVLSIVVLVNLNIFNIPRKPHIFGLRNIVEFILFYIKMVFFIFCINIYTFYSFNILIHICTYSFNINNSHFCSNNYFFIILYYTTQYLLLIPYGTYVYHTIYDYIRYNILLLYSFKGFFFLI